MKKVAVILFGLLTLIFPIVNAQDIDEDYLSVLLEEDEEDTNLAFKPVLGLGVGSFSFFGDVTDYLASPANGITSYRLGISRVIGKCFDMEFHGTMGSVGGNQYNGSATDTLNFRSQLFMGGVSVYYNFNHLLIRKRPIHPYVSLGLEVFQFSPKGDLKDKNGNYYNYWKDGSIRDASGNIISRDYEYETGLRELTDQTYSKTTVAIPFDLGVNFTITNRVTCRTGAAVHVLMSDYVDNVKGGKGWKNDIVMNTYISLAVDLFSSDEELVAVENFRNLKFTVTDHMDEDGDGVDDFNDECPGTPAKVKVYPNGCPVDSDHDGVPDYLDKQKDTPVGKNVVVDADGVKMSDSQVISLLYNPDAITRNKVKIYNNAAEAATEGSVDTEEDTKPKGIPDKFKHVDINGDRYISHEELQSAIDAIFEGKSTLTPADINELQDFFFKQ